MKKTSLNGFLIVKKGYNPKEVDAYILGQKASSETVQSEQKQRISELKAALALAEATIKENRDKDSVISKAIITAVDKAHEIERLSMQKYKMEMERLKVFHDKWINYYNQILEQYPLDKNLSAVSSFNRHINKVLKNEDLAADTLSISKATAELEKIFEAESARLNASGTETAAKNKVVIKASAEKNLDTPKTAPVKIIKNKNKSDDTLNSLVLDNGFDPIARISRYLEDAASVDIDENSEIGEKIELKGVPKGRIENKSEVKHSNNTVQVGKSQRAASDKESASTGDYSDRSELGFSFQEALNPTDDLEQIMKDLGFLSDKE